MKQREFSRYLMTGLALIVSLGAIYYFIERSDKIGPQAPGIDDGVAAQYAAYQDQFVQDFTCGVTDFDSPYVTPVECAASKAGYGDPIILPLLGNVTDEAGEPLADVQLVVNGGRPIVSDANGFFAGSVQVDSNKKAVNIVADKAGYAPVRKFRAAEMPNAEGTAVEMPETFTVNLMMREADVQTAAAGGGDITVQSEKYPAVSITVPAGGLVTESGRQARGAVRGEITYLDPNDPEDRAFTPGFDGNTKQMIGIDMQGNQVQIDSQGMTFLHFFEETTGERLQLADGVLATVTQPMPEATYQDATSPELQSNLDFTPEQYASLRDLGWREDMTEAEMFSFFRTNNMTGFAYWHFNERTGLWEEWPVQGLQYNVEQKTIELKVPRLY